MCTRFLPGVGSSTFWKARPGPPGRVTVTKKPGANGFTVPSTARAHQSASLSGSVESNVMFTTESAMPLTLDQPGDKKARSAAE